MTFALGALHPDSEGHVITKTIITTKTSKNIDTIIKLILDKTTLLGPLKLRPAVTARPDFLYSLAFFC